MNPFTNSSRTAMLTESTTANTQSQTYKSFKFQHDNIWHYSPSNVPRDSLRILFASSLLLYKPTEKREKERVQKQHYGKQPCNASIEMFLSDTQNRKQCYSKCSYFHPRANVKITVTSESCNNTF